MDINFGRWLAMQRARAGLTQKDIAVKCHLSDPYITRLESGSTEPPPLKTCMALARALGIQWEELWRRAFAARLEKWVRREGYSHISEEGLLEIAQRIDDADKQGRQGIFRLHKLTLPHKSNPSGSTNLGEGPDSTRLPVASHSNKDKQH